MHAVLVEDVDLGDVHVQAFDHRGLFLGGGGHGLVHAVDLADTAGDAAQVFAGLAADAHAVVAEVAAFAHGRHGFAGAGLQLFDHLLDLQRRALGALGQVAHFVGHHGEAASCLAGAGGFDGGVERQQVGLLGDALDHVEDLADVVALLAEHFDVVAGRLDLLRQLAHRHQGALDHALPFLGIAAGVAGLLRGVGGVAGDLLGGGTQFVDGGGHAVGAGGLLAGVGHGGVRRLHHGAHPLVHLARGGGHFADGFVDALDEAVEGIGQLAELVTGVDRQALGQVALALSDAAHGMAHHVQRAQQDADQPAQQQEDGDHADDGRHQRGYAELLQGGEGLGLVDGQAHVPAHPGQPFHRQEGHDPRLAVAVAHALQGGLQARRGAGEQVRQLLQDQLLIGVDQHRALVVHQEGVAHAAQVEGVEDVVDRLQLEVTADDALQGARGVHRAGDGDQQAVARVGGQVGLGQAGAAGLCRLYVPGPLARVVAGGQFAGRELGVGAARLAVVRIEEGGGDAAVLQVLGQGGLAGVVLDGLGQVLQQLHAAHQPVLDVARGDLPHIVEVVGKVLADGVPLQVIVVQREGREGSDHHQGGCHHDLVAEFQGSHGGTRSTGADREWWPQGPSASSR